MNNEVLTRSILTKEQVATGISLEEDEDFVYLVHDGKTLKTWNGHTVTIAEIRHEADQVLEWQKSEIVIEKAV